MMRCLVALWFALWACQQIRGQTADFENQVLAVLTKSGCNSGACHGAAIGRGGFRLSLFGQNPDADWIEVARSLGARRINTVDPENSLLLRKAGESIEHGGGQRLIYGSHDWQLVAGWIREGGQRRSAQHTGQLSAIEVEPDQVVGKQVDDLVKVVVWGLFSDGSRRDLTPFAVLQPQDPESLRLLDAPGCVQVRRPGRHVLLVRVRDRVAMTEMIVPFQGQQKNGDQTLEVKQADGNSSSPQSLIDKHVHGRLQELGLRAGDRADDATLLRRLYLDLIGQLPTPEQIERFLGDHSSDKVERLVERLLANEATLTKWTHWLVHELRMPRVLRSDASGKHAETIFSHYHSALQQDVSLSELFAEMVTAEGRMEENPGASFYWLGNDGRQQAEHFSELFLGVRMGCANCHNHPLDRWTQDDYHGLAAVFAGIRRTDAITWQPGATNIHPGTGNAAVLRLPDGRKLPKETDPRPALAQWCRNEGCSQISVAWTNRIWAELFGRGLVDPVDDLRVTNPPTHGQLLEDLATQWQANGGDLRWLLKEIVSSNAYQRESISDWTHPGSLERNLCVEAFAYRSPKRLNASVLIDIYSQATGVWRALGQYPAGTRAVSVLLAAERTTNFSVGDDACSKGNCASDLADTLAGKLALIAGPIVNDRLADDSNRLSAWLKDVSLSDTQCIEQMYLHFFSRRPTDQELQRWIEILQASLSRKEVFEDLAWSMLTSSQFMMNH